MIAKYTVVNSVEIRNRTYALVGVVEGGVPDVGSVGVSSRDGASINVEVIGIGVVDPNLIAPDRQGLLVKIISGDDRDLNGSTLEFAIDIVDENGI